MTTAAARSLSPSTTPAGPAGHAAGATVRRAGLLLSVAAVLVVSLVGGLAGPVPSASAATCPPAYAAPFTDIPVGHPFCSEIWLAKTHGVVGGYPDGSFQPTATITRQEAAAMLWNAANADSGDAPKPCEVAPFDDVPVGHPFCEVIRDAALVGVFTGYPDGTFGPTTPVTRQAAAAITQRFPMPGPYPLCLGPAFTDVPADHPFCGFISHLANKGIVNGYPDGSFHPTEHVSREAFVAILVRWIDQLPE